MTSQMRYILRLFSSLEGVSSFYLTGGTALSEFYLHHRISLDLDLFLSQEMKEKEPSAILRTSELFADQLKLSGYNVRWIQKHQQCTELIVSKDNQKTRVTLAFDTAPLIKPVKKTDFGVYVASFPDVATGKLCALQERMEHRDIFDVYFILKKMKSSKLLMLAKRRWSYIDVYRVAQLFSRIEAMLPPLSSFRGFLLKKGLKREEIGRFYKNESRKLLDFILR